jgi:cytochrome c oxidase assembly protein subunit 11
MNLNRRKNIRVAAALVVVIVFMASLVAYSPTLYRLFCAATGYAGTTQRVEGDDSAVSDRVITVRFDTSIAPDLPWRFEPVQREVKVHLGEEKLVFFSAENLTDQPLVGHATFNVTPEKTGLYFKKIQCFCFDDERLDAHQKVEMPVDFFVDPALAKDSNAQDVSAITLSYTFFRTTETEKTFLGSSPRPSQTGAADRCFSRRDAPHATPSITTRQGPCSAASSAGKRERFRDTIIPQHCGLRG